MRILIDTHYLIWLFTDTKKISSHVMEELMSEHNDLFYSQFSLWEMAIKSGIGKLVFEGITLDDIYSEIDKSPIRRLTTYDEDVMSSKSLPREYNDPFDHMIVWQAIRNGMILLSADTKIDVYCKHGLKMLSV